MRISDIVRLTTALYRTVDRWRYDSAEWLDRKLNDRGAK